jgi:hypothetical protein
VQVILMSICMIPLIRLLLIVLSIFLMYLFGLLASCCADPHRPLSPYRRIWVYPIRFLARCILLVGAFWWVPVTDHRTGERRASIIVANHISVWDMVRTAPPRPRCERWRLSRTELTSPPCLLLSCCVVSFT